MTVSINFLYQNVMKFSNMMFKTTKSFDNKPFQSKIEEKLDEKSFKKSDVSNISKTVGI